jgi:hypothetical protein
MPSLLRKRFCTYYSSDPTTGAQNVSADGSTFSVQLNAPLRIPANAVDCTISVLQASVWNTSPNIAAAFGNNVFSFVVAETPYTIVIPDGLYSLSGLNAYLSSQFVNLGLASNAIVLSGDEATQRTVLTFSAVGDRVDFTVANSVREVLGFDARIAPPLPGAPSIGFNEYSDGPAAFNRTNSYIITSDLVSDGIPVNSTAANVLVNIPIDAAPGSQVNYAPRNPLPIDAMELVGAIKNQFSFQLRNQTLETIPTAGELYSLVVEFVYTIPVDA